MPEEAARAVSGDEGEGGGARPTGSVTFLTFSLRGVKGQAVFLCLIYLFLCPAVLRAGDRGALLGSIISIWDRIWSDKNPAAVREGSGKPLPWPFGPHVAVNINNLLHTQFVWRSRPIGNVNRSQATTYGAGGLKPVCRQTICTTDKALPLN